MKRVLLLLAALTAVGVALAACTAPAPRPSTPAPAYAPPPPRSAAAPTPTTPAPTTAPPTTTVTPAPLAAPTTRHAHSRLSCLRDETQCYLEGRQCATGGCVNAARGLTPHAVRRQTAAWLARHPGYCAAGETGAVGRCADREQTGSDPGMRDANGETKAQYCARTGQPLRTCQAG